jgi:DNA-binding GntR family transcriptional regulator
MKRGDPRLVEILERGAERVVNAETLALTALRRAIITGALAPGEEIDEELVAAHLRISRSPVRQAMGILEAEGLVKRIYRRGVIVTELTAEEIEEIYNMRALLEGLAIRRAVPNYTPEYVERLRAFLAQCPEDGDSRDAFVEWNAGFHALLYEPCGWDRLLATISQLRNNTARYTGVSHHLAPRPGGSSSGHQEILEACESGDAERAEGLMRKHILAAMDTLIESLGRTGGWAGRRDGRES